MPEPPSLGPVELAVIGFPDSRLDGSLAPALAELTGDGTITVLDLVLLSKDTAGDVTVVELADLDDGEDARAYVDLDGAAGGLLSDRDLELAAQVLAPGTAAAVVVWEDTWARRLVAALGAAGGRLLAHDRIDAESVRLALADIDAELGEPPTAGS